MDAHIACTHDGDTLRAYKNGVLYKSVFSQKTGYLGSFVEIGHSSSNDKYFGGEIESVSTYNKGLSANEIRETMHVTPTGTETGLTGHWNFNENMSYYSMGHDSMAVGSPVFNTSILPICSGVANSKVENTGSVVFTSTDFSANYSLQNAGHVTTSRLDGIPYLSPVGTIVDSVYWVVNQFDSTAFTADFVFNTIEDLVSSPSCKYELYTRPFNAAGAWTYVDTATVITLHDLTFTGLSDVLGQLVIVHSGNCTPSSVNIAEAKSNTLDIGVYPNPSTGTVFIKIPTNESGTISIYNNLGQIVYSNNSKNHNQQIELTQGAYFVNFITNSSSITKKIIITK